MSTRSGIVGDVDVARSFTLTMLVVALELVGEVGMVSVISTVPPGCMVVHSAALLVEAVSATEELAV